MVIVPDRIKTMHTTNTAIILAGGRSLRMGFDKQLLQLNDEYLLAKNLNLLLEIFSEIIVVANDPESLTAIPRIDETIIVSDHYQEAGPMAGIHAGLCAASSDFSFILACDMPVLDPIYIRKMKEQMSQATNGVDGLINVNQITGEPEPFCAFYGKHLIPEVEHFIEGHRRSLRHFIDHHQFLRVDYPAKSDSSDIFFNINNKKDLRQYQEGAEPMALRLSQLQDHLAPVMVSLPVVRFKGPAQANLEDEVITEAELTVQVNGGFLQTMYATPSHLEELITGNLFAQGLIQKADSIEKIEFKRLPEDSVHLLVNVELKSNARLHGGAGSSLVHTSSGLTSSQSYHQDSLSRVDRTMDLDIHAITRLSAAFQDTSALFARTGGSHACALIQDNEVISFMEDIGRHNALDKLIGRALIDGTNLADCLILLSGRMASEMTMKVLKTPVSGLLSRAAPTDRSIHLAKQFNLTLIGFIRGDRLNIYNLNGGHRVQPPRV